MRSLQRALAPLALALLATGIAVPLAWALVSSLAPERALFGADTLLPERLVLDHYRALFEQREFWRPIANSLVVAGATTFLCLLLGAPCAYALTRLAFPGRNAALALVLALAMFPQISSVPPLFALLRFLGLIDTYPGLVLPYLTFSLPLAIWLLAGHFRALPPDLEEASALDGAGRLRTLTEIVLPLAAPGLATTAILTFVYCWNEFLFALSFTVGPDHRTVPVAIALFRGRYQVPWGEILAGALVASAPVVVLVLLFQRRIVRGLTAGAVKG
jgi:ABC-type glycerol-3-phosphate transport system permease component